MSLPSCCLLAMQATAVLETIILRMERDVLRKKAQYAAAAGSRHQSRRGLVGGLRGLMSRSHSGSANGNGGGGSHHGPGGLGGARQHLRQVQVTKREWDEAIAEALF